MELSDNQNKKKLYEFNQQNTIGKNGEYLIAELFPKTFKLTDGMNGDLIFKDKHKFELKTDTYKSGNLFFEKISNVRLNNVGGVWQTKEHGCDYYSFYMIKYDKLYIFEVDIILEWLNNNISKYNVKTVYNVKKETKGYAIPIKDVEKLCFMVVDLTIKTEYKRLKTKYKFDV